MWKILVIHGLCFIAEARGGYVHIILWSYVCPSIGFKPTQFQGEINPCFGTDLYFAEIYKRTILISQCSTVFLKGVCMYVLLRLSPVEVILISFPMQILNVVTFVQVVNNFKPTITFVS